MNLVDRLLLANLARLLRLADPAPPRVREDAIRAGFLRHPVTAGDQLGLQFRYSWERRTASAIAW